MPLADPKARKEYQAAYAKKHAKRLREYQTQYRKVNREEKLEYLKEWKKDNPNYDREWQKKHRDNKRRSQRKFRRAHPERIRAQNAAYATRKTGAGGKFTEQEWLDLKRKYKFRCLRCNRRKKLFPDHVKPVSKGGTSNISNIQPLCGICNSIKSDKFIDYRKRNR
jgi:5-methylcytosine-specific restriction endonuclease McrA